MSKINIENRVYCVVAGTMGKEERECVGTGDDNFILYGQGRP